MECWCWDLGSEESGWRLLPPRDGLHLVRLQSLSLAVLTVDREYDKESISRPAKKRTRR